MLRWFFAPAVILAASLVVAATAGATAPNRIVFQGTPADSQVAQLYSVSPSGDDVKQLTKGPAAALEPAYSPQATRIAFTRFGYGIYTIAVDGSGLKRLTTNARDAYPTYSPDGTQIAFVRPIGPKWRVFVVPSKGGKPRLLKETPPAGRPSWTNAGGLLIPTGGDLVRIDPKNGRVLKYYGASVDAIWGLNSVTLAPGLKLLTYVGSREPVAGDMECGDGPCQRFGLYTEALKPKPKKPKLLVKDAGPAGFSPDGTKMVYAVGGALVIRSIASGATTPVATPGVTPVLGAPPVWR